MNFLRAAYNAPAGKETYGFLEVFVARLYLLTAVLCALFLVCAYVVLAAYLPSHAPWWTTVLMLGTPPVLVARVVRSFLAASHSTDKDKSTTVR